ncbi:MAG: signal peptide peptidase SppA [Rikenellaceae bacterium]|nr:signal peptide peptidase SppA [Rikenellaceae bacterium]
MKFFKIFLATLLAMVVGTVLSWVLCLVIFVGMAGSMEGTTQAVITPQTIVKIDLAENITEAPTKNPMAGFDFATMTMAKSTHLLKVLQSIEAAKGDANVKGIYLNFTGLGGITTGAMEEVRAALVDFKQSGKFVVAYNETYSQGGYYLASVADKIYLHPEGGFSWVGLAQSSLFMKGALDKLGLKAEAFRPTACKYKSAVEPYIRKNFSPENRAQSQMMVDDMWSVLVGSIAESRNLDAKKLMRLADKLEVSQPEDALKHGLVDALIYEDEMEAKFAEYGVEKGADGKFNIISLGEYMTLSPVMAKFGAPAVGIVYAEGQVFDGEGEDDNVYSVNVSKTLRKAREDKDIKAVVFRVNSPGGSALASDVIWREVELLRKEKPVIVSMGSYAASGGYYISAGADAIVADRLTLTGSIGVFGMLLEGEDMLNKKLGLTTDVVKTGAAADFGANVMGVGVRKITDLERKTLLRSVDKVYDTFTTKVANGRNLPMDKVLELAQGRVWSGTRAVELGLADANGGLREAIAIAADKAGVVENFRVTEVLEELSPIAQMMQQLNMQAKAYLFDAETLEVAEYYNSLKRELAREGVQAYCPYSFAIN